MKGIEAYANEMTTRSKFYWQEQPKDKKRQVKRTGEYRKFLEGLLNDMRTDKSLNQESERFKEIERIITDALSYFKRNPRGQKSLMTIFREQLHKKIA